MPPIAVGKSGKRRGPGARIQVGRRRPDLVLRNRNDTLAEQILSNVAGAIVYRRADRSPRLTVRARGVVLRH